MLNTFGYVVESTGADSPSQNGGTEIYNNKLAVETRTLLYGAGLPTKFLSVALLHAVLWDLDIPQEPATIAYENNAGCTAMAKAQKTTSRT